MDSETAEAAEAAADHVLGNDIMDVVAVNEKYYRAELSPALIAEEAGVTAEEAALAKKLLLARHRDELPEAVRPPEVAADG